MRGLSARCGALLAAALATYPAPAISPEPATASAPAGPALRNEAVQYARPIMEVVERIGMDYVRPVPKADLIEAALTGLYDAARQPVPPGLKLEVRRAVQSDGELHDLLVNVRESLGPVDALRGHRAVAVSLQALPRALDPHCGPSGPQEFKGIDTSETTPNVGLEFAGVTAPQPTVVFAPAGVRLPTETGTADRAALPTGPVRVQAVIPGGPGQRAGVRPGDLVVKIDGRPYDAPAFPVLFRRLLPILPGMPYDPAAAAAVRLTLLRPGRPDPVEAAVAPAVYRPESVFGARRRPDGDWDYLLDPRDKIGYVRVGAIGPNTHTDFHDALKTLRDRSARGLVLDLRWCPGGLLNQAATIARLMLPPEAVIATQKKRTGQVDPVQFYELGPSVTDLPIVALVNGETSGGGELIAAALQDHGRGVVAGQRTVGKGSVQGSLERSPVPFKITTGTFLRPSGKNLQRYPDSKPSDDWGVRPDAGREIPLTPVAGRRLKEWWTQFTLRPAGSTEALPLDDPENDPQRQAAAQMVRDLLEK